ncbi:16414_t:CDS:1, partial [Entrophospora sp. SA101]
FYSNKYEQRLEESCHIEVGKREFGLAAAELMAKVIEKESKVI